MVFYAHQTWSPYNNQLGIIDVPLYLFLKAYTEQM